MQVRFGDKPYVSGDYDVVSSYVPKGKYPAIVESYEEHEFNTGAVGLNLKFKIIEGDYNNRVVFGTIFTNGISEDALNIGRGFLQSIFEAVGLGKGCDDFDECLRKPLIINVIENTYNGNTTSKVNRCEKYVAETNNSVFPM